MAGGKDLELERVTVNSLNITMLEAPWKHRPCVKILRMKHEVLFDSRYLQEIKVHQVVIDQEYISQSFYGLSLMNSIMILSF